MREGSPRGEVKTKEAEKERAIKIIEEKLEEKKEHEAEANPKEKSKKTGHFWSDCKVYFALTILVLLALAAVLVKVFVLDPKNGVTFSETSNRTKVEQEKNSNQKYTGVGYIPDYDGY